MSAVRFTVFSDYLCPWCYVGAVRLAHLEAEYGQGLELTWRSFLLRPEPEDRPLEKFVRYTRSWERPASQEPRAHLRSWSSDNAPPSHSVPPAVAAKAAATFGRRVFEQFHRALFEAYFVDHRTVSDREVLIDLATGAGIDASAFDNVMRERRRDLAKEVFQDYAAAVDAGIFAVPTVVVNDEHVLRGALDENQYRRVITAAQ